MTNRIIDVASYPFQNTDSVLLDTNIWLYLFPAPSNPSAYFQTQYSGIFRSMLSAKVNMIFDVLVLGEYINRYARIEHKASTMAQDDYKRFRNSPLFDRVAKTISTNISQIIRHASRCDFLFSKIDLNSLLVDFENKHQDVNDCLLIETCIKNNWKLLTNDADFTDGGIEVLTLNRKLLNP